MAAVENISEHKILFMHGFAQNAKLCESIFSNLCKKLKKVPNQRFVCKFLQAPHKLDTNFAFSWFPFRYNIADIPSLKYSNFKEHIDNEVKWLLEQINDVDYIVAFSQANALLIAMLMTEPKLQLKKVVLISPFLFQTDNPSYLKIPISALIVICAEDKVVPSILASQEHMVFQHVETLSWSALEKYSIVKLDADPKLAHRPPHDAKHLDKIVAFLSN